MNSRNQNATAAIIGTGFMGRVHSEALRRIGVRIAGILGSTAEKSQAAADALGIERGYGSLAELLADPTVNAVHINTPNRLHYEMVKHCIAAGQHVMCEKPLAMNSAESGELVQLAADNPQLVTGVNYNIRFYPIVHEVRQRLQGSRIFHVSGSYVQDWLLYPADYNWRVLSKEGGALRAVADIGTHWLDVVQFVTGQKIRAVCADLLTVHSERQRPQEEVQTFQSEGNQATEPVAISTDDYGCVMFRCDNDARGVVHVSQVTAGRKNCLRFEIATDDESLAWNSEQPNELWIGHRGRPNEILLKDPSLLSASAGRIADNPGGHNEGYADTFKQCFAAFYQQIRNPESAREEPTAFASFADGHREVLLCEAILASHQQQAWVEIP